MATKNPFLKYKTKTQKAFIKALDAEITYRDLTMAEKDDFNMRMMKDSVGGAEPELDFEALSEMKYEKASAILVQPKMSVDELKALSSNALPAIAEINSLVSDTEDEPTVDEEGK